jgi:regulator of nucleoside diphosphate kinase
MQTLKAPLLRKPAVYMTGDDYDELAGRARAMSHTPGGELLAAELERAILAPKSSTRAFARLHSRVEFEDLETGMVRTLQLCLPEEASLDDARLSVFTPVGAALIGLSPGQTFEWTAPEGRVRRLRVIAVSHE